jgi:hypothetical protein
MKASYREDNRQDRQFDTSLTKPETLIFPVGKCRFPMSCQDPASWSLLMCRSVNSAMSIRQAGAA